MTTGQKQDDQTKTPTPVVSTGVGLIIAAMWIFEAVLTVLVWLTWQIGDSVPYQQVLPLAGLWFGVGMAVVNLTSRLLDK